MSNNLINTALSGLNAAQAGLAAASNNISNYSVAGYNRQTAIIAEANGSHTASGYMGNGVNVTGINREYNSFVVNQLLGASTNNSALTTQSSQATQIENLFADSTTSLSKAMQTFFTGIQTITSNASDTAARQTTIGQAQAMTSQFNRTANYLNDLNSGMNQQIRDNVQQINNYAQQLANLNQQISQTRASTGQEPNSLLDQRDQIVSQLNDVAGVTVSQQDGGDYNVSIANGIPLVQGTRTKTLTAMPSDSDASRLTVGLQNVDGSASAIDESRITNGSLGGVLNFRKDNLEPAINQLGQLALTLADSFNTQSKAGFDLKGQPGVDFFSFDAKPNALANARNTGTSELDISYTDTKSVKASDYTLSYGNDGWTATRVSDGAIFTPKTGSDGSLTFDGLSVKVNGTPAVKDSFTIKTVSNVASTLKVAISDSAQIAAAGSPQVGEDGSEAAGGASDNLNAQKLLDLQKAKIVDNKSSLSDGYASMVSSIGNQVSALKTNVTSQGNIVKELTTQQQSISGVNLNEEYGNLQRYQQYYQANAQVVQTASTIFNALISAL